MPIPLGFPDCGSAHAGSREGRYSVASDAGVAQLVERQLPKLNVAG